MLKCAGFHYSNDGEDKKCKMIGADLVVHSATKALGGHNDLMAGAIICKTREQVGKTCQDAEKFVENLKVIKHAVSLGCPESLVCLPVLTTMLYMLLERRLTFGVRENTVRMSCGIEESEKLIEDIKQSLEKL